MPTPRPPKKATAPPSSAERWLIIFKKFYTDRTYYRPLDALDRRPGNTMFFLNPKLERFDCDITRKISNHHLSDRIEVVDQHLPADHPVKDRPVGESAVD